MFTVVFQEPGKERGLCMRKQNGAFEIVEIDLGYLGIRITTRRSGPLMSIFDIKSSVKSIFSRWARVLRSLEMRKSCVLECVPPDNVTATLSNPFSSEAVGVPITTFTAGGT